MNLLTETPDAIYIDNNMLSWWRSCHLSCYYQAEKGLRLTTHTPATYFGTKWHEVMKSLWGGIKGDRWNFNDAMKVVDEYDLSMEQEEKGKTKLRLEMALIDYASYLDEGTGESYKEIGLAHKPLIVEEFLSHEIMKWNGKPVYYCGIIDRCFELDDSIYLLDYKTTSWNRIMDAMWGESPQFKGYIWLLSKVAPSFKTNTFILDLFQMQSKVNNKFLRRRITFDDWLIKEWEKDRVAEITEMLSAERYTKEPACSDYGGCPFVRLCQQPPSLREEMGRQFYYYAPWDIHGNVKIGGKGNGKDRIEGV